MKLFATSQYQSKQHEGCFETKREIEGIPLVLLINRTSNSIYQQDAKGDHDARDTNDQAPTQSTLFNALRDEAGVRADLCGRTNVCSDKSNGHPDALVLAIGRIDALICIRTVKHIHQHKAASDDLEHKNHLPVLYFV